MNKEDRIVVGLGEIVWDVLPEGKKLGGAPANFAYHVAQMGMKSMAVSAIGTDELGTETLAVLDEKHLDYHIPRVPQPTGQVLVTLDDAGVPQYDIKQGAAWDNIPFTPDMLDIASRCRAVCFGSLAQRSPVSRATIEAFIDATPVTCLRICDVNLRQQYYNRQVLHSSLERCNILKINDEEIGIVAKMLGIEGNDMQAQCRALLNDYNLTMVVLTCGENGSYVITDSAVSFKPTPKVTVADTVGAGDSFTGAFCAGLLQGLSVTQAHERAVRVSAYVCTQPGAMPEIPEELKTVSD